MLKRLIRRKRSSVEVSEEGGLRALHLGGDAVQSAMKLSAPSDLALAYTQAMMAALLFAPQSRDILMIGLGGGSLARFVHERMPATRMVAVELNEKVVAAARTLFGLPNDDERLAVVVADGAAYVPAHPDSCDLLLLDAFEDGVSVAALATGQFYDACRRALRDGGVLAVNFMVEEPRLPTYLARLEEAFGGRVLCMPAKDRVNLIAFAFRHGQSRFLIATLKARARALARQLELPYDAFLRELLAYNSASTAYLAVRRKR